MSRAHKIAEQIQSGTVWINCWLLRDLRVPFGGMKKSGTGLPSASALVYAVTHRIAWTVNHSRDIEMAQGLKAEV